MLGFATTTAEQLARELVVEQTADSVVLGIDSNRTGAVDVLNCRPVPN